MKRRGTLLYILLGILLIIVAVFLVLVLYTQNQIEKVEEHKIEYNLQKSNTLSVNEVIKDYEKYSQLRITVEGVVSKFKDDGNFFIVDVENEEGLKNNKYYKTDDSKTIKITLTNRLENTPALTIGSRVAITGGYFIYIWNLDKVIYNYEIQAENIELLSYQHK